MNVFFNRDAITADTGAISSSSSSSDGDGLSLLTKTVTEYIRISGQLFLTQLDNEVTSPVTVMPIIINIIIGTANASNVRPLISFHHVLSTAIRIRTEGHREVLPSCCNSNVPH